MAFRKTTFASLVVILTATAGLIAQGGDKFKVRLAPAPALGVQGGAGGVAGLGSATATWNGKKLTVNGSFEKMVSPPTVAKIGLGLATGARGDLVIDLTLTKPDTSTVNASWTVAPGTNAVPTQ